jgi:hypothetical protein
MKSPTPKAGFEVGDTLPVVDGYPIFGLEGLVARLGRIKPHKRTTILAKKRAASPSCAEI